MLKMCEKVTKIFRSRSTATVRTDFVGFSRRFSILGIRSRFQSPFLGLYVAKELPATNATARLTHFAFERYSIMCQGIAEFSIMLEHILPCFYHPPAQYSFVKIHQEFPESIH